MNRRILMLFLLSVGVVPVAGRADPVEEVHQLLDRIENAWEKQDLAALEAQYADEGMLAIVASGGRREGAWVGDRDRTLATIADFWEGAERKGMAAHSHRFVERNIRVQHNVAWLHLTVADQFTGRRYQVSRALALALKRDGKWRMCFSMPLFVRPVVLVTDVPSGSEAQRVGIKVGDVVVAYAGQPIKDLTTFEYLMSAHARHGTSEKLPLGVIRGRERRWFDVPPGELGMEFEARLMPADGAVLVEAHEPHPIKETVRTRLETVKANDFEGFRNHLCPQGYFSLQPVPSGAVRLTTQDNLRQRWNEEVSVLHKEYDITSLQQDQLRLIVAGDVALMSSRVRGIERGNGQKKLDAPMRLQVYVRKDDHWWLAAILPKTTQIGLDVHGSYYRSAAKTTKLERRIRGTFSGVGLSIITGPDGIRILEVLRGGAAEVGLEADEIITQIDGRPTAGMTTDEAVGLLRGEEGTTVRLKVLSISGNVRTVSVTRRMVVIAGVRSRLLAEGIGLLQVKLFNRETVREARRAFDELSSQGAARLVLDLRGNTGGIPDEIRKFAELFIGPDRVLWFYRPLEGKPKAVRSKTEATVQMPLVVLVDSRGKGGELVAATVKRNERGKLIGQKTSGKTIAKELVKHEDGSSELVVKGEFFITRRTPISGRGIQPHVRMPVDASPQEVLEKAIEVLEREINEE